MFQLYQNEKWVEGLEGLYSVTTSGEVYSFKSLSGRGKGKRHLLKPRYKHGYLRVSLNRKWFLIHRLVYTTFVGTIPKGMQINHKNEIRDDNRLENLELVTPKQNSNFGKRNEKVRAAKLQFNPARKGLWVLIDDNPVYFRSRADVDREFNLPLETIKGKINNAKKCNRNTIYINNKTYHWWE